MWYTVIAGIGSTEKGAPPALAGADRILANGRDGLSHAEFNAGVREIPVEYRRNKSDTELHGGWGHQGACGCDPMEEYARAFEFTRRTKAGATWSFR